MTRAIPKSTDMNDPCPNCGAEFVFTVHDRKCSKCRPPGHVCNPGRKSIIQQAWDDTSPKPDGSIDRQAEQIRRFKALRDKFDSTKYPYQLHISKTTKQEYLETLETILPKELIERIKAKDEEIAYLRNDLIDLDCGCIAYKMDLSEPDPANMIDLLQGGIQGALNRSMPK